MAIRTITHSKEILSVILGGGAGTRLFPLTASRSKPAVPIAGKYRLVDIPISNCLNNGIGRMFVLTQFNSASLNRHIKNTYHFSAFSKAFVDILAAEQTPDSPGWFQGTADAVRQSLRHIEPFESDYILILSGDQLYQMDFADMLDNHKNLGADISVATIPVAQREAPEFGILKSSEGLITSFIEKPKKDVLEDWVSDTGEEMKAAGRNYLASMGIYISTGICCSIFSRQSTKMPPTSVKRSSRNRSINTKWPVTSIPVTGPISEIFIPSLRLTWTLQKISLTSICSTVTGLSIPVRVCCPRARSVAPPWRKP